MDYNRRYPEDVKHFPILWQGDGYLFGKHKFDNLRKLLQHFENIPALGRSRILRLSLQRQFYTSLFH